ncbi:LrgB family protein [Halobacteriovorax sp. GFR7]|uniref:LrgB family protein n=1 Tax=unclassified Halobacteriovorax TaxID=2639665 RepID=UPI003D9610C7
MNIFSNITSLTFVSLGLTLICYCIVFKLRKRYAWLNLLIVPSILIFAVIQLFNISYEDYEKGCSLYSFLLGPFTVALGVPMFKEAQKLKGHRRKLCFIIFIGSLVSMISAGVIAWIFGASFKSIMSVIPKSVTTPIAIEVSKQLHGDPSITIAVVIITGILGSSFSWKLLHFFHIRNERAVGTAMGTCAHALGTVSAFQKSETSGGVSSLSMALAGILTSIIAGIVTYWL